MTRDAAIDPALKLIEIRLSGLIDGKALNWGIVQIEKGSRDAEVRSVIWDLRNADLSQLSFDTIRGTVEDWPSATLHASARIAVVAGKESDKLLLQLWREAGLQRDSRLREVFIDMEAARAWVLVHGD